MTLFFFFSSRRRHTRLQGDWSSDVCSSDLVDAFGAGGQTDRREQPLLTLDGRRIGEAKLPGEAGLGDHAERDGLTVRPALVTAGRLQRVADRVSVVEHGAQVGLLLVPLDDPSLEPARAPDDALERRRIAVQERP